MVLLTGLIELLLRISSFREYENKGHYRVIGLKFHFETLYEGQAQKDPCLAKNVSSAVYKLS